MLVRAISVAVSLLFVAVGLAAHAADGYIQNYENVPIETPGGLLAPETVREAMIAAGAAREWRFSDAGPGKLIGSLQVRGRHMVEVDVAYSPERYSLTYRSSINMNYRSDGTIHPNYNVWVKDLLDRFRAELVTPARLATVKPAPPPPAGVAQAVAASAAPARFPQAGDTWTYRLTEPKRRDGPKQRTYEVKIASASASEIRETLTLGGKPAGESTHKPGSYLVAQGVSVFSPYLSAFDAPGSALKLRRIEPSDPESCNAQYGCTLKGKIAPQETIGVPAGKFDAVKVTIEQIWYPDGGAPVYVAGRMNGSRILTIWYSPTLKRAVKFSSRLVTGGMPPIDADFDLELVSHQAN